MFRNLYAEMGRAGFTYKTLAKDIGISEVVFGRKINGKVDWKVTEMIAIQQLINKELGTSYTLDYLFSRPQ